MSALLALLMSPALGDLEQAKRFVLTVRACITADMNCQSFTSDPIFETREQCMNAGNDAARLLGESREMRVFAFCQRVTVVFQGTA